MGITIEGEEMKCRECNVELNNLNWSKGYKRRKNCICRPCNIKQMKEWRERNYHKVKLQSIKQRAGWRKHEWNIPKDVGYCLISSPCAYCGSIDEKFNGLDRVDSDKGYTLDNVVPCCTHCNRAKCDMTVKEFEKHINKIYNYIIKE